jgi:uncharacterized protein (DUF1684 family)
MSLKMKLHGPLWPFMVMLLATVACTSGPTLDDRPYQAQIQKDRADKDAFFRSADGPLEPEKRAGFTGLVYYPIDSSYQVPARLEVDTVDRETILQLDTSKRDKRRVRRIGKLHFTLALPNTPPASFVLTAFVEVDSPDVNRLFVPFTDVTSNNETYGGGRYLELNKTATGLYDLDFNRAYHPFCVFNPGFECPVPPRENKLMTAIRAGEKLK